MFDEPCRGRPAAVVTLAVASLVTFAVAETGPLRLELWGDPSFQSRFLGRYGVDAEIEPRVSTVERQQMEEILPLLASDPEEAAIALEAALAPEASAVFDFTLGNVYYELEKLYAAGQNYENAIAKFPSFRRAHENLGLIRVRLSDFEGAIEALSEVIELGGGDGLTYGLLGYAYSQSEQYVAAESAYRGAVLLDRDVVDWKLGLTQAVLKQRKYGEAIALSEELLAADPGRRDLWLLQANAYIGLGEPMKAAENFELVYRMGQATAASMTTLGDIYVNEGLWTLAARSYGASLEIDSGQEVRRPLGKVEVLAQRGALRQASSLLDQIGSVYEDRLDPEGRTRWLKLRARLTLAEGEDEARAVDVLEEIVALDPLDGEALLLLGDHYARHAEPDRAVFYFERAASVDEHEADASVRHAQLLVEQERYGEALPLLERAQEIEPRDDVERYISQVERVSKSAR